MAGLTSDQLIASYHAGGNQPLSTAQMLNQAALPVAGGTIQPKIIPQSISTVPNASGNYESTNAVAPTPITAISSSDVNNTIQDNNTNTQNILSTPQGAYTDPNGIERNADGSEASAPAGATLNPEAGIYTFNGKNYTRETGVQGTAIDQANLSTIAGLRTKGDALFAEGMGIIQKQYEDLINTQKQTNAGAEASTRGLLIRAGSYDTSSASGIFQAQVTEGLNKVSNLVDKENSALLDLKTAYQNNDAKLANDAMNVWKDIKAQQTTETKALMDKLTKANKDAKTELQHKQDQIVTENNAIDSSIRTAISDAQKGGAKPEQIKAMNDALAKHDYAGAVSAAGNTLSNSNTGVIGEYNFAVKQGYKGDFMKFNQDLNTAKAAGTLAGKTPTTVNPNSIANSWNVNDASYPPKGDGGNVPYGITGRTPNDIWQSAITLALDKSATVQKFLGGLNGSSPEGKALKSAIANKSAALVTASGVDTSTLQQEFAANSKAISKQVDYMNSVERNLNGADTGVKQVLDTFSKNNINQWDSTYANTKLNSLAKNFQDSGDLRAYQAALVEIGNEYSQVFSRGGQRNEKTDARAQDIINGNVTLADLAKVTDELQAVGKTVVNSAIDQVKNISTGGGTDAVANFLSYVHNQPSDATMSVIQSQKDTEKTLIDYGNKNPSEQQSIIDMETKPNKTLGRPLTHDEVLQYLQAVGKIK